MRSKYILQTAVSRLASNKPRAALTILGIVIGVASIMLIVALGRGAENLIISQIQSIGSRTVGIVPGRRPQGIMGMLSTFTDSLKNRDLEALKKKTNAPHIDKIMPVVFGSETIIFENETYRPTIFGVTGFFSEIYNAYPEQGRIFTEEEVSSYADVAVIGSKVADELFGNSGGLNQKVKIKGRNFRIIGILGKKGQSTFVNFDDVAIVPYTTAQQYLFGIKYFNRIVAQADTEENVDKTVEDIKATLREAHNITDPEKDDFFVETQAEAMSMMSAVTGVITSFLASVAAISLIVGGIGVMNIMFVSVQERTREIGLRKALGATDKDILNQFLIEAILLTVAGGVIGIAIGAAFSFVISIILTRVVNLSWEFTFPISAAALGFFVSALVGVIFGLYPARQASRKSPIEALRYE